jgi:GH24 family phage-related lysozyme (muramidase)
MTLVDCLQSKGMSEDEIMACAECLGKTLDDLEEGIMCLDLEEVGYCDDVIFCEVTAKACNNKCTDKITTATACIIYSSGCGYAFKSECLSGDNNPDPSENPCSDYVMTLVDCLQSEGMSEDEITACTECLGKTLDYLEEGTMCLDLEEAGYCDDVVSCEVMATACNNKCTDEITTATACIIYSSGCGYAFDSECLSGI